MSDEKTILIIEPDENVREGVKNSLADKPCRFIELEESGDAVMQLAIEGPNLVVVSTELPDGDGVELIKGIRDFDAKLPIVVLIGEPTKEKIVQAKLAKAIDILLKPPDYERLSSKISNRLWLDPSLIKPKDEELSFEGELKKHQADVGREEPLDEAVPKGAELLNINDVIGGMKLARTLMFEDVVYGEKGQVLTDDKIKHLNKMGVPEVCVYIDQALKKKVELKKKEQAKSASIKTTDAGIAVSAGAESGKPGERVFAKVKRSSVRVTSEEPATITLVDETGESVKLDAVIADISAGGCALLTKNKIKRSTEITMNFTIDEGKFQMNDIKGIVRHSMRRFGTDEFPQRNGVFFTNITERFRENLITVLFRIERENKKKDDELRARYGYAPKRSRKR